MITLTDTSALRFWATHGQGDADPVSFAQSQNWAASSWREVRETCAHELGFVPTNQDRVHVLVEDANRRIQSASVASHVWSSPLPAGAFCRAAPGVLVASPAFCCLLDAARSSLPHVVCTVMECMGLYGRVPDSHGFVDRPQLVSRLEMESFVEGALSCPGSRKLRRAIRLALERSRSPMETKVIIILTLPNKLGGYGLPRPKLNVRIVPGPQDYPVSQFPLYEVDACWDSFRVILEFDSYLFHMSPEKFDADAKKRNSLKSMGWKVTSVTAGQLSGDALDVLAHQLARDMGISLSSPAPERRDWLINQLV